MGFVDYYEALQLSSKADIDTIERVFRHLAKKFHPDNTQSADNDRFQLILNAYQALTNPENRVGYNVKYQEYWDQKGSPFCHQWLTLMTFKGCDPHTPV